MPKNVALPLGHDAVRELRAGDEVLVTGRLVTGRDKVHARLVAADDPAARALLAGTLIYHCAPVVSQDPVTKEYRFVAAGPSDSSRHEQHQAEVIARYGIRGMIGRGGMGERTLAALEQHGAVYLHAVGGLAVVLARTVAKVYGVLWLDELGIAEALWDIEVKDFPAVVTMDAHGNTLHGALDAEAARIAKELAAT